MTTAIYPGTFDPITSGHIDVAERAARLVDRLIVAVAVGHHKAPRLSVEERVALVREALHHVPNVEAAGFDGLIVDFAAQRQASVIVRGLRTTDSLSDELAMAVTNRSMNPAFRCCSCPPLKTVTTFLPQSSER